MAAVVPLAGATAVAAWLLPRALDRAELSRLDRDATSTAQAIGAACASAGDRATALAAQLQAGVLTDPAGSESVRLTAAARQAVAAAARRDPAGAATVYAPDLTVLAASGDTDDPLPDRAGAEGGLSCSRGDDGAGAWLVESVAVVVGQRTVARVAVGVPVGAVVAAGQPSAGTDVLVFGPDDGLLTPAGVAPVDPDQPRVRVRAVGGFAVEAVSRSPVGASSWWLILLAAGFVVVVVGLGLLLSRLLVRPVSDLSALARRISDGDVGDAVSAPATVARTSDEVEVVRTTLTDLARGLYESEQDVVRTRGAFVGAFERFGSALGGSPDADSMLRAVADAALLAVGARLSVVTFVGSAVESPVGSAEGSAAGSSAGSAPAGSAPVGSTVALLVPGSAAGARPVVVGEATTDSITDPDDMAAALAGMNRLAELGARLVPGAGIVLSSSGTTPDEGWAALVPLRTLGATVGHLGVVRRPSDGPPDMSSVDALTSLADHAATALLGVARHRQNALLSLTDPLTGIGNVRHLRATLDREVERAVRFGHTLAVLMIDIDHFKDVNDTHGHGRGDLVLAEVARRLGSCVREVDTVARYGGEEFCILLPETDVEGAGVPAHRILTAISTDPFTAPGEADVHVTVSVGVASYPTHGRSSAEVMKVADDALYEAKRAGRNRVVATAAPTISLVPEDRVSHLG